MIKNIIFDLGGVMIDLNRLAAVAALEEIGMDNAGELLNEYEQRGPFLDLETGRITAGEFFDAVCTACHGVSPLAVQEAFNHFLVALPVERLAMLRRLREAGYRLYVLSNTNPLMFNSWIADAFQGEGRRMQDYFDGIVCSFQEGMCKPAPDIFRRVVERYSLEPSETLMLDDSAANCAAARSIGLEAVRIDNGSSADSMLGVCERLLADVNGVVER